MASVLSGAPIRAVDAGAAGGVPDHWRDLLPVLDIDCFEPNEAECGRQARRSPANVHWFPLALAGSTGTRRLHVLNRPTGSSLYPPNDAVIMEYSGRSYAGVKEIIDVACMSLTDFLTVHERSTPVLVKLDTQGTELEILSSLDVARLANVLCVEVEVEFVEMYQDQPTFNQVHEFMCANGFRLLDLRTHRAYRNAQDQPQHYLRKYLRTAVGRSSLSGELVAGDALYLRDPDLSSPTLTLDKLARYLALLRLYRFYDLSFWLVEKAFDQRVVTSAEREALVQDVSHGAPRPRFHDRTGVIGAVSRAMLSTLGFDDHEVFWTRRAWPDQ